MRPPYFDSTDILRFGACVALVIVATAIQATAPGDPTNALSPTTDGGVSTQNTTGLFSYSQEEGAVAISGFDIEQGAEFSQGRSQRYDYDGDLGTFVRWGVKESDADHAEYVRYTFTPEFESAIVGPNTLTITTALLSNVTDGTTVRQRVWFTYPEPPYASFIVSERDGWTPGATVTYAVPVPANGTLAVAMTISRTTGDTFTAPVYFDLFEWHIPHTPEPPAAAPERDPSLFPIGAVLAFGVTTIAFLVGVMRTRD
jgi:hypothetical protein